MLVIALAGVAVFSLRSVQAQNSPPIILTEAQISGVKDRCLVSKVELDNIHSADGLQRVNVGQRYADISSRLMAPMNSRIALNGLDGLALNQTTVKYNEALDTFRRRYVNYDESTALVRSIDCQKSPVEYYAAIESARERRKLLRESVDELNSLIKRYQKQLKDFRSEVKDA